MSRVVAASLHPFKGGRVATSCDGEISELTATARGFEYAGIGDREIFAVAPSETDGELMTITLRGRTSPQGPNNAHAQDRMMGLVETYIAGERQLTLSAPGLGSTALDLSRKNGPSVPVALHKGRVFGIDVGPDAADFIRTLTGRPDARLMRVDREATRTVGGLEQISSALAADDGSYSLTNHTSLAVLNSMRPVGYPLPVPMALYRPSIEVDEMGSSEPFAEHLARTIAIGEVPFRVVAGLARCVVATIYGYDHTVPAGLGILKSRIGVKVDESGNPEQDRTRPYFGVSLQLKLEPGEQATIAVDAPVHVLEWAEVPNVAIKGETR